jgi:hypothetical protein
MQHRSDRAPASAGMRIAFYSAPERRNAEELAAARLILLTNPGKSGIQAVNLNSVQIIIIMHKIVVRFLNKIS